MRLFQRSLKVVTSGPWGGLLGHFLFVATDRPPVAVRDHVWPGVATFGNDPNRCPVPDIEGPLQNGTFSEIPVANDLFPQHVSLDHHATPCFIN